MVVKENTKYKETEIGMIPEDWEVESLGTLARIYRGASPRPIDSPIWFDENSNVGWVRISDVSKSSKYLLATTQKLSEAGIKNSRFIDENNLIMSICATVGRPIITQMKVCIHDGFVVFENSKIDKEYLYYYLMFIEDEWFKYGQIGSQMNLNTTIIQNQQICYPTLSTEQTSVIEALNDIDQLINSLEKLLIKKRSIKQGAMQELLSGKKRLPEFAKSNKFKQTEIGIIPEDWEIKKLGDMGEFKKGKGIKKDEVVFDGLPCIRYGEIYTVHSEYIKSFCSFISSKISKNSQLIKYGDILFAGSGETAEEIGKCIAFLEHHEAYAGGDIIIFSPHKDDSKYLGFLLNQQCVIRQKAQMAQGDAVVHIYSNNLSKISCTLPSLKEEQTAIAQVLSDMDLEINALETKLTKYQQIKQGMMENLLTGRIRLV